MFLYLSIHVNTFTVLINIHVQMFVQDENFTSIKSL